MRVNVVNRIHQIPAKVARDNRVPQWLNWEQMFAVQHAEEAAKLRAKRDMLRQFRRQRHQSSWLRFVQSLMCLTVALLFGAQLTQAQELPDKTTLVKQAIPYVAVLQEGTIDPPSFRLRSVYMTPGFGRAKNKGWYNICFVYSGHNRMGGFSDSTSVVYFWGDKGANKNGTVETWGENSARGWFYPCDTKHSVDITADVKAASGAQ